MLLGTLSTCFSLACSTNGEPSIALVGASVIDGTGTAARGSTTVLIRGERIAAVGADVQVPQHATVIDVSGKSIVPGLIDMHGHMNARPAGTMRSQFDSYPQLFLAGGVTTVRSPGDYEPQGMVALKQRIQRGEAIGPRIYNAGPYMDNAPSRSPFIEGVESPEAALRLLDEWKDRIDWIKVYTSITEEQLGALLKAGEGIRIPVTGHLGSISGRRAIDLGIHCLEHGIFAMSEFGSNAADRFCSLARFDMESPVVEEVLSSIVDHGVAIDPTVVVYQAQLADFEPVTPDWKLYLSPEAQRYQEANRYLEPAQQECMKQALRHQMQFVRKLHERGGLIIAGTDPVLGNLIPGYALHRELRNLVEAGLTPLEAIRAATLNAATVLRQEENLGSIEPGKLADLVVVDGDPSRSIAEIGNTVMVFQGGVRYDPASLRESAFGRIR